MNAAIARSLAFSSIWLSLAALKTTASVRRKREQEIRVMRLQFGHCDLSRVGKEFFKSTNSPHAPAPLQQYATTTLLRHVASHQKRHRLGRPSRLAISAGFSIGYLPFPLIWPKSGLCANSKSCNRLARALGRSTSAMPRERFNFSRACSLEERAVVLGLYRLFHKV